MVRRSRGLVPLAVAVVAAGVWLSAAAAPGPVRGGSAGPEATAVAPAPGQGAPTAPLGRPVDLRAGPGDAVASDLPSSRRRLGSGDSVADVAPARVGPATRADDAATRAPAPARPAPAPRVETATVPYRIVQSGRPRGSTDSSLAYDGDPRTRWAAGDAAPAAYAWFDLGAERPVALVRWLQTEAAGAVAVQVSSDRERWTTVAREDAAPAGEWQALAIGERARYVRLVFAGGDGDGVRSGLAEIEIYGPPGSEPAARSARSTVPASRDPRAPRDRDDAAPDPEPEPVAAEGRPPRRSDAVRVDTSPGVAECDEAGGGTCVVRGGRVDVHEDCGGDGSTCRIDISVDGGTAACDESGGNKNKAGRGRGARNGNGGTCHADASGGTVELGDINP